MLEAVSLDSVHELYMEFVQASRKNNFDLAYALHNEWSNSDGTINVKQFLTKDQNNCNPSDDVGFFKKKN